MPFRCPLRRLIRPGDLHPPLRWIVQHGVFSQWETLLDVAPGSLRFRRRGPDGKGGSWHRRRVDLHRPHAVALTPEGRAVIADTDNDRLVVLDCLDRGRIRFRRNLSGVALRRPHHVLFNPHDGCLYVVDATHLYRIHSPFARGEAWRIHPRRLGYVRALSLIDRRVHIVASSHGTVLRVDSFNRRRLTTFASPRKRRIAPAGTWGDTGLVLNDVAQIEGWYYGTNYFTPDHADRGNARRLRFFRWRTWTDFCAGKWQDLSGLFARGLIPYFLTPVGDHLHIAAFCHADHRRDGIFVFDPKTKRRRARRS